jgi:hypothetical protein
MGKVANSRLVILTSAGEPGHFSYKVLQEAYSRPQRWRVSETPGPLPWVDPENLEAQRPLLRDSEFERLHLNRWTQSEDRLVSPEDLDAALILDGPQEPRPNTRYVVTVDLGLKHDRTVAVVAHSEPVDANPGAPRRVVVDRLQRWQGTRRRPVEIQQVEEWLATASRQYNRAPIHCDPWQAVGVVQRLNARSVRASEFAFSQQSVGRLADSLHLALRNHLLLLPEDDDLRQELGKVRLRETSPGVVRLDHDRGQHDDQAIAIGMACTILQGESLQGAAFLAHWKRELEEREQTPTTDTEPLPVHFNQGATRAALQPTCQHRWMVEANGTYCVFCGGWQ